MNRTWFYALGFSILVIFDTWTQTSFKLAAGQAGEFSLTLTWLKHALSSVWTYAAIAGYLGAFFTWMTLLKHAPVGPAFAATHLEVVSVLMVSVLLFGEHLGAAQVIGAVFIVAGIIVLSRGEPQGKPDALT